ncbi:hypothetical protein NMY22_g2765 [Coprinellus aureogranulatus]|nr:hypothetical protein NMY22_g2765 [Coprinellus aureogranulatus]
MAQTTTAPSPASFRKRVTTSVPISWPPQGTERQRKRGEASACTRRKAGLESLKEFIASQRSLKTSSVEWRGSYEGRRMQLDFPSFHQRGGLSFGKEIQRGAFSVLDPKALTTLPHYQIKTQSAPLSSMQLFVKFAKRSIIDPLFVTSSASHLHYPSQTTKTSVGSAAFQVKSEWIDAAQPMDVVDEHPPLPLPPTKKAKTRPSLPARSSARRSAQKDIPASTATSGSSRRGLPLSLSSSTSPPYPPTGEKPLASLTSGPSTPTMGGNSVEALGLLSSSGGIANGKMQSKGRWKAGEKGKDEGEEQGRGRGVKKDKPKPETYKQACSVEEQHPLEQLLEEIPEGVGFRFVLFAFFVSFPAQYSFVRTSFSFLFVS